MSWTNKYVGLRYDGAEKVGIRCWTLVARVLRAEAGLDLPEYNDVASHSLLRLSRTLEAQSKGGDWVPVEAGRERALDVVLMTGPVKIRGRILNLVRHCGIVTPERRLLHTEGGTDAVCVGLDHRTVKFRLAGTFRHRQLV